MASAGYTLLLLLSILYGWRPARGACNVSALSSYLEGVQAEYDREAPPAVPVPVALALHARHASLVDGDTTLKVLADLYMNWTEPRLAWNVSEIGCVVTQVAVRRLWVPDVAPLNASAAAAAGGLRARLFPDGAIAAAARLELRAPLRLDLASWPADTQQATLLFGSVAHTDQEILLQIPEYTQSPAWENAAWEVVSTSPVPVEGGRSTQVAWTLWLRRNAPAAAAAAHAALVAALMLLLAACAAPLAARPPLCAAAAFISILWLMGATGRLGGGDGCPRLARLQCAVATLAAAGAALAVLAGVLRTRAAPAPPAVRTALLALARVLRLDPNEKPSEVETAGGTGGPERRAEWAAAARLLDLLALVALAGLLLAAAAVTLTE